MSPRTVVTCFDRTRTLTPNLARYERIAPFYDVLDFPFERRRYHALRPLLFQNLKGRLLDAGIGTGRNCAFYPPETIVSGIDTSPAMLARARRRCPTLSVINGAMRGLGRAGRRVKAPTLPPSRRARERRPEIKDA